MKLWITALMLALSSQTVHAQVIDPIAVDTTAQKVAAPPVELPNPDQPPILVCVQPVTDEAGAKQLSVLVADRETKTVSVTLQNKTSITYLPIHTIATFKKDTAALEYALTQKARNGEVKQSTLQYDPVTGTAALNTGAIAGSSLYSTCKSFEPGKYIQVNVWIRSQI